MGSATAYELARRGRHVVLLEQFSEGHARGSSHGATRIFRVAYREEVYSRLAAESIPLWRRLEEESGEVLLEQTGQLDHGFVEAVDEVEATLRAGGWNYDRLTPDDAHERWPGMRFDTTVIYSPDGGRVFADRTVATLVRRARELGAEVHYDMPVERIERMPHGVRVISRDQAWDAPVVVVAAGAWLPQIEGLDVALPPLRVTQQQPVHFGIREGMSFPSYIHHVHGDGGDPFPAYGLESPGEGVKLGLDVDVVVPDPSEVTLEPSEDAIADAIAYAQRWLPGADTSRVSAVRCLFTMTPDSHFVLDRRGPIVVCSPCSGHGFKFTPIIGAMVADLADGQEQREAVWRLP